MFLINLTCRSRFEGPKTKIKRREGREEEKREKKEEKERGKEIGREEGRGTERIWMNPRSSDDCYQVEKNCKNCFLF